jgi:hypothetical protein
MTYINESGKTIEIHTENKICKKHNELYDENIIICQHANEIQRVGEPYCHKCMDEMVMKELEDK